MIRVFFQVILPLMAPLVIYGLWLRLARRRGGPPHVSGNWLWALGAGIMLALASIITAAMIGRNDPDSIYYPPVLEDGVIRPGRFEPRRP